jgi:hypothetical protein
MRRRDALRESIVSVYPAEPTGDLNSIGRLRSIALTPRTDFVSEHH